MVAPGATGHNSNFPTLLVAEINQPSGWCSMEGLACHGESPLDNLPKLIDVVH